MLHVLFPFSHNHNSLHLQKHVQGPYNNILPIRELPRSFASGSLTVTAIFVDLLHVLRATWTKLFCSLEILSSLYTTLAYI